MQPRIYKVALAFVAAGLLLANFGLQKSLHTQRVQPPLSLKPATPLENAPPVLAFSTVALGSFRGLISNILWVRANELQNQGKYFEMVQLADWITKLEPTFTEVWVVQAWNMAYNISIKFTSHADRWRWVQRGIELLRDYGLRYNPDDALMYRELGWFFQHKIGQTLDDAHNFYKASLAKEMTDLFGGARPDFAALINPQTDEARKRAEIVRQRYKMDPVVMKEVDDEYGPLDWRLPEAHAIYWATLGLKYSQEEDKITVRRVIYQSMAMTVLRGRIIYIEPDGRLHTGPDLSKVDRATAAYQRLMKEDKEKPHAIKLAYGNFLREVLYLLYVHNRTEEARKWFAVLKREYPEKVDGSTSVEEFGLKYLDKNLSSMSRERTKAVLDGLIVQHFLNLALDQDDRAEVHDRQARQLWQFYDQRISNRRDPLRFPPYEDMKRAARDQLLDPQSGLLPELAARLRTKLGLPPPPTSSQNIQVKPG